MQAAAYIYSSAKLRTLEAKILDTTDIERMVDAPDLPSAFKVLHDTDYADNLLEVVPTDYRLALSDDYFQLYRLYQQITPDRNLFKLIFFDRDLVNIKLIFKEKFLSVIVETLLKKNCVHDPADLRAYIINGQVALLDIDTKKMINDALKELGNEPTPDAVDSVLTKHYFILLTNLAKRLKRPLIKRYVTTLVNNANIKTILRAKRLNLDKTVLKEKLIPGGSIEAGKFLAHYDEEIQALKPLIITYYDAELRQAFDAYLEENLLYLFEKALDDYKTKLVSAAQFIAYGPEVLLAYHVAKQNAVANIRIIMTGKMNGIPSAEIKKTLRMVR